MPSFPPWLIPCRFSILILLAALAGGAASAQAPAPSLARAYSSEAGMTPIARRKLSVETTLSIVGPAPATTGRVTRIAYYWRYDRPVRELSVQLCQRDGPCVDISSAPAGATEFFRGASPAKAFYFRARVGGQGPMAPVAGLPGGVVVNWEE